MPVSEKNSVLNLNLLKHKFNKIPVGQTVLNLFMLEQHFLSSGVDGVDVVSSESESRACK